MDLLNRCCFLNHDFNNFANWRSNFPKVHSVADVQVLFARITFPESNGLPVKIGHPGRKLHFLTVDFQGQTVSFREGSTRTVSGRVRLAPASRRFFLKGTACCLFKECREKTDFQITIAWNQLDNHFGR